MTITKKPRAPMSEQARKNKNAAESERQKSTEEVRRRGARNKARRHAIAAGKAKVGDGKEIGHKVALSNGGAATDANTKVQSVKDNGGWRKGKSSYKVPNIK
jgi:hypothetical protein